jgi:hypothetical protein
MALLLLVFIFSHSSDNSHRKINVADCLTVHMKKPMSSDKPFSSAAQGMYLLLLTSPNTVCTQSTLQPENGQ